MPVNQIWNLVPFGRRVLGLEDERVRLPFRFGREVLVVEQRLPVGRILHGPGDVPGGQTLGSGSQRQPIPLAAADGHLVLSDHDFRRLGTSRDGRHRDDLGPTASRPGQCLPRAGGAFGARAELPLVGQTVAVGIGAEITILHDRRPLGRAHRVAEPLQQAASSPTRRDSPAAGSPRRRCARRCGAG